jgi:hypothetical protein
MKSKHSSRRRVLSLLLAFGLCMIPVASAVGQGVTPNAEPGPGGQCDGCGEQYSGVWLHSFYGWTQCNGGDWCYDCHAFNACHGNWQELHCFQRHSPCGGALALSTLLEKARKYAASELSIQEAEAQAGPVRIRFNPKRGVVQVYDCSGQVVAQYHRHTTEPRTLASENRLILRLASAASL